MKRNLLILPLVCFTFKVFAQWSNTSDNTTIGKLGIGIAPLTKFHINNNDWHIQLENSDPGGSSWFIGASSNGWNAEGGKFVISPNSSSSNSLFTISNLGNVGIGTNKPESKLHISNITAPFSDYSSPADALLWIGGRNDVFSNQYINFRNPSVSDANGLSWWSSDVIFGRNKNSAIWGFKETHGSSLGSSYKDIIRAELVDGGGRTRLNKLIIAPADPLFPNEGFVGIGTNLNAPNPNNYRLAVNGTIGAKAVKVEMSSGTWSDYVFEPSYRLLSLPYVESFINENKHLPDVPSAKEVEKDGIDLGKMDATLLKKIEELTLYVIEQNKRIELETIKLQEQDSAIKEQKKEIDQLKRMVNNK